MAAVAAVVLGAAACGGSPGTPGRADPAASAAALPAHVQSGAAAVAPSPGSVEGGCDPLRSLRPTGPLPGPGALPAGSTMARIRARGRLIVGVDQNTYLFGYRDAATGTVVGFDVDLAGRIAQAIFGGPGHLQLKVITNAQRISALQSGSVDLVAHSMTMNCDRWRQVDFSTAYLAVGKEILVHRNSGITGLADLRGKRACAAKGTSGSQVIATAASRPTPVTADNWTDCLVLLQQNQVDAIVTDSGVLAGLIIQDPNTELVGGPFTQDTYGLAFAKQTPDLVRFVNALLERMRSDGSWRAEYDKWLAGHLGPESAIPPLARYSD